MKRHKISRRRFVKNGLTWIAGTAFGIGSTGKAVRDKEITSVSRTSLKSLLPIPTTCEQCPAGCGVIAYLDGDKLVQILGNPNHPNNQGGICAKGIAGINLVNDPERLLHPLKRAGARGSGEWIKISWDEAYSTLSHRIQDMLTSGRISEFVVDIGHDDPLLDRFLDSLGTPRFIQRKTFKNANRSAAIAAMVGSSTLIEDVGRSRTILNFGTNPFSNHDLFIGFARKLVLAMIDKGTRLITFDIRMSKTAAKSDAWYPVKAGTDGVVALAMANVIVKKGLANSDFIEQQTDLSVSSLKQLLSPYSPEIAEQESGVKAADIVRIAVEFATQKPSVAIFGGGITDHLNGTENARCVSLLNWIVGNLEKEGGLFFPRHPGYEQNTEKPFSNTTSGLSRTSVGIPELMESKNRIDTYFSYLSNPVFSEPDCQSTARLLKNEKTARFLVVMDTHLTETAMLADIVLPAATYLEGWGLRHAPPLNLVPVVNIKQPAVALLSAATALRSPDFTVGKLLDPSFRPMGEAVEIGNVCLELARRIRGNVSKKLPFQNTQEFVSKHMSSLLGLSQENTEDMKKKGFWIDQTTYKDSKPSLKDTKSLSTIPRVRIKSKTMDQPLLPEYQAIEPHKNKKKNEFILTSFKSNLSGMRTANSKWAREIIHENQLWMNKKVASQMGIKNNDRVRVTSTTGSLIVRVLTTHRIHPESVALAEDFGHTAVGNVAKNKRFKSTDRDTVLIWWNKKRNGVNPMEIIERQTDPVGGGLGSKDTVVRVEKIS
jgi:anaerobic selenocysteine-containing dehydrogenase